MRAKLYTLIGFLCIGYWLCLPAYAQQRSVSGNVTSGEDGTSLPGVNVILKGTNVGTVTDLDGNYRLNVPDDAQTLTFSFIGFTEQDIDINGRSVIDVQMASDIKQLTEVIVTAVGIEREKRALGYAVSEVSAENVAQASEPDPIRALQGKVAGVNILSSSGIAGGATNITIRGKSSLLNNNQPLFVVDGVPFDNSIFDDTRATSAGSIPDGGFTNRAFDIDPNTIESVTVLKGAAASALYGSRAANGVILITTKAGKKGGKKGLEVTVNSSYNMEEIANTVDIQEIYTQGAGFSYNGGFVGTWGERYEVVNAAGGVPHPLDQPRLAEAFPEFQGQTIMVSPRNNAEEFFRTGHVIENSLNIVSGGESSSVIVGFSRMDNAGIVPNNKVERTTINLGGNAQLDNGLFVTGSINYVKVEQDGPQIGTPLGGGNTSITERLLFTPPNYDLANYPYINPIDNSNVYYRTDQDNPYWLAETSPYVSSVDRYFGNVTLAYDVTDWLSFTYRAGFNAFTDRRLNVIAKGSSKIPNGEIIKDDIYRQELDGTFLATITKDIGEDFNIKVDLGQNINQRLTDRQKITGTGIIVFGINDLDNTSSQVASGEGLEKRRLIGLFGNAIVSYKDWAFLTLTARNDWSSTLPKAERSFLYPSTSLSVAFTEALNIQSDFLSFGKIRASYGKVGNDADPYLTKTIFLTNPPAGLGNGNLGVPFTNPDFSNVNVLTLGNTIGNGFLKPEFTTEYEVGTELNFMKNRINLDFTYYFRKTTDQIVDVEVPATTGSTRLIQNIGEVQNKGIEVALGLIPVQLGGFTWNINSVFTRNRSEIIELGEGLDELFVSGFTGLGIVHRPGLPYGQIIGTDYLRDPETDLPLINPDNGVLIDNPVDQIIGDPNPDFNWSVTNSFTYKGVSVSFLVDWVKGGDQLCYPCGQVRARGISEETAINRESPRVIPGFFADPDDPTQPMRDAEGNKVPNDFQISANDLYFIDGIATSGAWSHNVMDASAIRLREVRLGYSVPQEWLERTPFGSASIAITGRNLWYEAYNFPADLNYDPEVSSSNGNGTGINFSTVPTTKRYGVNLRFSF